ncbi:CPBP family intramembrane glutamic endopeptidase [Streptomyces sp. 769]|uniref:CPBP family intramembrane glutamic endopeptidase n=1 Tax=Streptomyces sp. 769 TaxID=1262452 RepID=UPI00131DE885|nr:CPBP family intramembrane glutamic endopeptidase [Streptomyces sp. 769]
MRLPASALMFLCPAIAAVVLVHRREGRAGVVQLLKRVGDFARVPRKRWYAIAVATPAAVALATYGGMRAAGADSTLPMPLMTAPALFATFLVAAAFEEVGWTGYATAPMLRRWGALSASLLLGAFWGVWHLVPLLQAHHGALWIAGWFVGTVAARLVMVWLYLHTGGSVPAAMCLHAMLNVYAALIPHYDLDRTPVVTGGITALLAAGVVVAARRGQGRKVWRVGRGKPSTPAEVPC